MIQFSIPKSLVTFIQRAGRAGRSPDIEGEAVLMVEASAFRTQRVNTETDLAELGADERGEVPLPEYKKDVEESLRRWIDAKDCRRRVVDECFNNPPRPEGMFISLPSRSSRLIACTSGIAAVL